MTSDPKLPSSDDADQEATTTPAGQVDDLEEMAEDNDATTGPKQET